ncbi:MAG: putative permease [Proteobacteria bacterium]|nr:putative permease [Pseudomonadota bacterium]
MLSDPAFIAVAVLAVLLIGLSKSGFGGAMGGLSVPLMSLLITTPQAAAIMLPIMLVLDALGLVVFRGKSDRANLRIIIPGGMIGIVLGALTFHFVDARWIKAVIGIEALLFGVDRLRQVRAAGGETGVPAVAKGLFWSSISGFTSFISHAGGPPILQYLLPQGMDRVRLVGTTTIFFAVVNFAKLLPYGVLGLLDMSNATTSLALLPVAPVGYWIGLKLLKRLPVAPFNLVVAIAMLLTGLKLVADALLN